MGVVVVQEGEKGAAPRALPGEPAQEGPIDVLGILGVLLRGDRDQGACPAPARPREHVGQLRQGDLVGLATEGDVAGEDLPDAERVVLVVREAPGDAGLAAAVVQVGDEPGGVIAERSRASPRAWGGSRPAAPSSRPRARGATAR